MPLDPYLGEILIVAFNFAPKGWAMCNGQFLPINQNQALFSILGTTYGGNGQTNFALPDFRGRIPAHWGGNGILCGSKPGSTTGKVTLGNLPAHTHVVNSQVRMPVAAQGTTTTLENAYPAPDNTNRFRAEKDERMAVLPVSALTAGPVMSSATGGNTQSGTTDPYPNMMPYLVLNFIIALQGVFPSET